MQKISIFAIFELQRQYIQQDPMGQYQLGQKNTVYLKMIYLGVQCMYFRSKPLQNQCILELVHYTKQTVYLESYFDLNPLKMIVNIKFDVNYVKLNLIITFNLENTLHQLLGNETSLAQKTKIEQRFYTPLEIVYLEDSNKLKKQCILDIFVPEPKQCICIKSVHWGRVPWGLAVPQKKAFFMQNSNLALKNMICFKKIPKNKIFSVFLSKIIRTSWIQRQLFQSWKRI